MLQYATWNTLSPLTLKIVIYAYLSYFGIKYTNVIDVFFSCI